MSGAQTRRGLRPGKVKSMLSHDIQVFADYHQFYLWDSGSDPVAPVDYTDDDVARMVKVEPRVLVVQPVRNMDVPVRVSIHEGDPGYDATEWDQIVDCSLDLPTGQLQIHESTGEAVLDLEVEAGVYAARVLFKNLDSLSDDGLDGDDAYQIDLWLGVERPLEVVKKRAPLAPG